MKMLYKVATGLFLISSTTFSLAQEIDFDPGARVQDLDLIGINDVGWLPGEYYDPLSGRLNHYMTDLVYEGNGLPINVSRTFQSLVETSVNYAAYDARLSIPT